jgi:hypothetical protein
MANSNIFYNDGTELKQMLTEANMLEHNNSPESHKPLFAQYTKNSPKGIFEAMHKLGVNYKPTDETTEGFAKLGHFCCTYTTNNCFNNQPSQFGQLISYPTAVDTANNADVRVTQIWLDGYNGDVFTRTGSKNNPIKDQVFTRFYLMTDEFNRAGTEFPLSGLIPGMLYYRTDEQKLYILQKLPGTWKEVFDTALTSGVASSLSHAWWKLDNANDDTSVYKFKKNEDLNTYTTPGCYSSIGAAYSATLNHCPYTAGNFRLVVQENIKGWGMQILYAGNQNETYSRGFSRSADGTSYVFTGWEKQMKYSDTISHAVMADADKNGKPFETEYLRMVGGRLKGELGVQTKLNIYNPDVTFGNNPADPKYNHIIFRDKDFNGMSTFFNVYHPDGSHYIRMGSYKSKDDNTLAMFGIGWNNTGKAITSMNTELRVVGDIRSDNDITAQNFHGSIDKAKKVETVAPPNQATDIVSATMGTNDQFRIRVGGASNDGWVEFATADNGEEPIYMVQYNQKDGNSFGEVKRRATILDKNGNTTFPGILTAQKCVNAIYNDYAEFFERGEETSAGDIIALDLTSEDEKYVKATNESSIVVGVQSDEFAYVIGGMTPLDDRDIVSFNMENYIPVALMGRVHVKVAGEVHKGGKIIPSDLAGVGKIAKPGDDTTNYVGICLEDSKDTEIRRVRMFVRR